MKSLTGTICSGFLVITLLVTLPESSIAQVFSSGPSDSSLFTTVINVPPAPDIDDRESIGGVAGETTQLNVADGGSVGTGFGAFAGSEVNISGGSVGNSFNANSGSEVNISGGSVGFSFDASAGSEVNISGGNVGTFFRAFSGSDVELIGGEFRLNGAEFTGTTISLIDRDPFINRENLFTGTLADGSAFLFSRRAGDSFLFNPRRGDSLLGVTLTSVPLPAVDMTPIVVVTPLTGGPSGLRAGQTLTLQAGGELGDNFAAINATLNIAGGTIGTLMEVAGSEVNVISGSVGHSFDAFAGSKVNISGGSVSSNFNAFAGSEVNISGGSVGDYFRAHLGSEVSISGGSVGDRFIINGNEVSISGGSVGDGFRAIGSEVSISGGSVGDGFNTSGKVNISGGSVGDNFRAYYGSEVSISGGSVGDGFQAYSGVNLFGSEFLLDDLPLDKLELGDPFTITERDVILSGILADGSAFSFDLNSSVSPFFDFFAASATLTVTLVPEPSCLVLLAFSPLLGLRRQGRGRASA